MSETRGAAHAGAGALRWIMLEGITHIGEALRVAGEPGTIVVAQSPADRTAYFLMARDAATFSLGANAIGAPVPDAWGARGVRSAIINGELLDAARKLCRESAGRVPTTKGGV